MERLYKHNHIYGEALQTHPYTWRGSINTPIYMERLYKHDHIYGEAL